MYKRQDEQISKVQSDIKKKPMEERHMVVIQDADTMTLRAQNRLLKTLEEPFEGTVMILLSENRENLLETIKSRCVLYRICLLYTSRRNTSGEGGFMD